MVFRNMIELLGYLAMTLIGVSFLMKDIFKLRIVSFIGAVLFVIYGLVIGAFPVMLLNIFISVVNAYYIFKLLQRNK